MLPTGLFCRQVSSYHTFTKACREARMQHASGPELARDTFGLLRRRPARPGCQLSVHVSDNSKHDVRAHRRRLGTGWLTCVLSLQPTAIWIAAPVSKSQTHPHACATDVVAGTMCMDLGVHLDLFDLPRYEARQQLESHVPAESCATCGHTVLAAVVQRHPGGNGTGCADGPVPALAPCLC